MCRWNQILQEKVKPLISIWLKFFDGHISITKLILDLCLQVIYLHLLHLILFLTSISNCIHENLSLLVIVLLFFKFSVLLLPFLLIIMLLLLLFLHLLLRLLRLLLRLLHLLLLLLRLLLWLLNLLLRLLHYCCGCCVYC